MRIIIGGMQYRKQYATFVGQGTGRFTPEEILKFKRDIYNNVDALLKASRDSGSRRRDEVFWVRGGDEPTEADMTLYGLIVSSLVCAA